MQLRLSLSFSQRSDFAHLSQYEFAAAQALFSWGREQNVAEVAGWAERRDWTRGRGEGREGRERGGGEMMIDVGAER